MLRFIKHIIITNLQSIPLLLKHIFVTFLPSREKQMNRLLLVSVGDTDKQRCQENFRRILNSRKHFLKKKKGKRKVQGVPQSQTAALPRPQEEEETDKSKQAQTEQTYEKH